MSEQTELNKRRMEALRIELDLLCQNIECTPKAPLSPEAGAMLLLVAELRLLRGELRAVNGVLA